MRIPSKNRGLACCRYRKARFGPGHDSFKESGETCLEKREKEKEDELSFACVDLNRLLMLLLFPLRNRVDCI